MLNCYLFIYLMGGGNLHVCITLILYSKYSSPTWIKHISLRRNGSMPSRKINREPQHPLHLSLPCSQLLSHRHVWSDASSSHTQHCSFRFHCCSLCSWVSAIRTCCQSRRISQLFGRRRLGKKRSLQPNRSCSSGHNYI